MYVWMSEIEHDPTAKSNSSNSREETAWKVSKYGVTPGPYFPVFGLNTEIYGAWWSWWIRFDWWIIFYFRHSRLFWIYY